MGIALKHVLANRKTGRLSYRRVYPPELRPFISGQPIELKRSLKASSITAPQAIHLYQQADQEWEANVAYARKVLNGAYDPLDGPTIAYLTECARRDWQAQEERGIASGDPYFVDKRLNAWTEYLGEYRRWAAEDDVEEIESHWSKTADAHLTERKLVRDPSDAVSYRRLCKALNYAMIAFEPTSKAILLGGVVPLPPEPQKPSAIITSEAKPSAPAGLSFDSIAESVLESPLRTVGAATKQSTRTALRFLKEAYGPITPQEITRAKVTEWLELLAKRPAKLSVAERALPLLEVVKRYEGQEVTRLTNKTLATHLGSLAAIWTKARDEDGLIPEDRPNPFGSRKSLVIERPEEPQQFSVEELNALFQLPVFTIGERPRQGKGEASYWLPLLLLWTGARPEELAQLLVSDITEDPSRPGRPIIRITDVGDHPTKGKRNLKTTAKSNAGRREFPIPRQLIDLNFMGYVDYLMAAQEAALFPALRPKGERGLLFDSFSPWWNGYVQEAGIIPANAGRRAAREFRHNWTSAARASGIQEDARAYIQGHFRSDATSNADYGSKRSLGYKIDDLKFEGLDLSHVRRWAPRNR